MCERGAVRFTAYDPGGGGEGGGKAAMEIPNHRSESKLRQQSNGGDGEQTKLTSAETGRRSGGSTGSERAESNATTRNTSPATANNNSSSISSLPAPATATASSGSAPSDLKYLHKKFKRIASATVTEEDDQKQQQQQSIQERESESAKRAVREPATGNSFPASSSPQQQQQLLVPLVRPSATVAPLISHSTPPSSSVSRPFVPNASPHHQASAASGDRSVACDDPPGDESTKIVAVRTPSGGGTGGGEGGGGFDSASGGGVPTDTNKLAKSPYSPLGGGAVQYIVAYPQQQQRAVDGTLLLPITSEKLKYHPSLHYANGGQPSHRAGGALSSSSGGSSGSPSPPSSVISSLGASSGHHHFAAVSSSATSSSGVAVGGGIAPANSVVIAPGPPGRYVCPYCQMNCSKPSVLEKHIRRHTNERPFKCDLCGIAFKTKSNLYKHRRSRAHASKSQCEDPNGLSLLDEDGGSLGGSDIEDKELSNSGSEIMNYRSSPMDERVHSPQQLLVEKPYKPKFHNAALYTKVESKPVATVGPVGGSQQVVNTAAGTAPVNPSVSHYLNGQNVESLEQHISKLISQNEAIVEVVEAPLQKKYHKITGISRGISVSGSGGTSSSSSFSHSSSAAVPNNHNATGVSSIPTPNSQPPSSAQDTAESRLAIALQQKRHAEEQQLKHQQQMQQMLQMQHQQLQHQPSYVATYSHLPGQQSVINLTNRPVVTPKSAVGLQQQPQPQPLASVVVVNGILPTGTPTPPSSGSMESASGNAAVANHRNQHNNDGGNSYQPLNLTKVNVQEQIPTSTNITVPSSSLQSTASYTLPPESEDGQAAVQQNPLLPYRKRTREQSLEKQLSNVPVSTTAAELVTGSVSIATATTTTCSTTTLPVSTTVSSGASTTVSASQPPHVPLHIQVSTVATSSGSGHRPTPTPTPPLTVTNHPQNPERSIIKDLLLNSRAFGVVQNPDGENGESLYTCKMCNVSFRDVDSLKYHMICYCQGTGSPSSSSAPISPVGSPSAAAASYIRSRSVSSLKQLARSSLNPPPARTPASLTRLAKSQLTRPRTKPDNISLPADSSSSSSSSALSSGASSSAGSSRGTVVETVQNPLPSPGPLLGNTRLVDSHRADSGKTQQKAAGTPDSNEASLTKRTRVGVIESGSTSSENASSSQKHHHAGSSAGHNALQLFGGELEVVARKPTFEDEAGKMSTNAGSSTLPVHRYAGSGGSFTQSLSGGMEIEDEEAHQRALHYRQTLHSGGTLMELARTEPSTGQSAPPKVTAATPTHFQFPPINSITAFNPLTLPAVPAPPPGQASQIVHGGKLIPFVQGMPGPNTLSSVGPSVELLHASMEKRPDPNSQSLLTIVVPSGAGNTPSLPTAHPLGSSLLAIQQPGGVASSSSSSRVHLEGPLKKQSLGVPKNGLSTREIWSPAKQQQQQQQADFSSPSPTQAVPRKSFNFTRMADNVSPRKKSDIPLFLSGGETKSKPEEIRYFNFETMISTSEIMIKPPPPPPPPATMALTVDTSSSVATSQEPTNVAVPPSPRPNKFLRPNSLPLKPGTFTPKRHHGITPTNNTMPLISPETPRPSKSCRELYFNGHAYTNIGLKSSTKPFYCTVNKTQPFYFQTQKQLSMYSNWQVHPENDPHPLGLRQVTVMALYDSNHHRDRKYSIAGPRKVPLAIVGSRPAGGNIVSCVSSEGQVRVSPMEVKSNVPCPPAYVLATLAAQQPSMATLQPPTRYSRESPSPGLQYSEKSKSSIDQTVPSADSALMMVATSGGGESRHASRSASAERALSGGFESTEEYTYVRGRGRGKYVCNECGIRCKKPSMLKKHIRTHTDVRPYSCQYCSFHFKTKGNLTKHMKSKSHFKKCTELGLNPVPTHVDDDGGDIDIEGDQQSVSSERTSTIPGDSDTATDTDGDETDDSDEMKSRLTEHEAAEGLLLISMTRPTSACSSLGTGQQHSAGGANSEPTAAAAAAYISQHISSYLTPEQQQSHGLLYPTRTSPNPSHSPMLTHVQQQQQQQQQQVDSGGLGKLDSGSASLPRRIITYGNGPKLEFNLLKHEQYYSDPNLGSKKKREHERTFPTASDEAARAGDADDEDDTARPIDLTKKPRHQPAAKASSGSVSSQPSSYHQYDDRSRTNHPQTQPLAMVTPPNAQELSVGNHHPMIRPLDREQLALHQRMYENRHREPASQQLEQPQPQVIVRVSDVLTPISGAANLLTSLVSNTDKIPMIVAPFEPTVGTTPGGVDENSYFHEYLKERALQDTRIKQSQMKPGSSIVMREQQHSQALAVQPQLHGQLAQEQVRHNVPQHQILLQPRYEDAHAPASANNPGSVLAQAPLAAKATPPPAALPPVAAATGTTILPPASAAATVPPPATERVYRIFSGKNERHRVSPTTEPAAKGSPASQTNEIPSLSMSEAKLATETVRPKHVPLEMDGVYNTPSSVCSSVVTTGSSNSSSSSSAATSLRVLGSECPLVSENASPMDTLAEIAAGSVKLDVSKVQQLVSEPSTIAALTVMPTPSTAVTTNARSRCNSFSSNAKVAQHPVPESAKNLASEYLKLAQSVTSGGAMRKRADSESASGGAISDHETTPITLSNPPPQIAPAVPVLPFVIAPVPEAGVHSKPIATVAPIVANIAPQATTQQQQAQQPQPTGGSGNGSTVQGVAEVAAPVMGPARKVVVVGEDGFKKTVGGGRPVASAGGEFVGTPPNAFTPSMHQEDGGRPVCEICNKKFHKLSQLSIHMNIHYMERKYRCEPCGTSFRSQGLYLKHERSATHRNKVSMTTTFGVATDTNPRPFYCRDCEVGFRIHGHLAKHLRSKMHVLKLECLGKLPFGTYTEIERSGTNLTEIDTSDCENSLSSLKRLAVRLNVKDPAKVLPAGGGSSASSSSSSSGTGGTTGGGGGGGGTSGNETDSCDDNFGMENGDDELPSGGSKDDMTPSDSQGRTVMTNGGESALDGAATPCNGGGEMRNINNNVKRKMDEFSSAAEDVATCSTTTANLVSDAKRPRYSLELPDEAPGSSSVPQEEAEAGVAASSG
ncbi:AGAP007640-PA-like protein [Anopheles sinensis]|uniref:AGAP007640-PA-like protein n=1 Tax=Anopheles sinensis TaxID=74873 RepID=A0A084VFB2_ANOSI|nr:AGAP007640-PA-like protein [Anopheles sinensis]